MIILLHRGRFVYCPFLLVRFKDFPPLLFFVLGGVLCDAGLADGDAAVEGVLLKSVGERKRFHGSGSFQIPDLAAEHLDFPSVVCYILDTV